MDDFDLIRERVQEKASLEQIAMQAGISKERVRQRINRVFEKLIKYKYLEKWKKKENLLEYNEDMLNLILMLDNRYRRKIMRLINYFGIKHPSDFLNIPNSRLNKITGVGKLCILNLKLILLKLGYQYDSDNIQEIMEKIDSFADKNQDGLKLRFKILERDGFKCKYCGKNPRDDKTVILHVDHIFPESRGGSWEEDNLVTSCRDCNLGKSDRIINSQGAKKGA